MSVERLKFTKLSSKEMRSWRYRELFLTSEEAFERDYHKHQGRSGREIVEDGGEAKRVE